MRTTRSSDAKVSLTLRGRFRIIGSDGSDRTPGARKEGAILALLACTPRRMRTRSWLRSILWSDRSTQQAQTSFRRALSNLRKRLGPDADILDTEDPLTLTLAAQVQVLRGEADGGADLLETLDGVDPAL
ncbi:hypothetical protein N9W17_06105, partial [Jannaschia sp.]|nr:hypothetical protein [Jannaschia sp.]